jgi:hypothetical protein
MHHLWLYCAFPFTDVWNIVGIQWSRIFTVAFQSDGISSNHFQITDGLSQIFSAQLLYQFVRPAIFNASSSGSQHEISSVATIVSTGRAVTWPGFASFPPTFTTYTLAVIYEASILKYQEALVAIKAAINDINQAKFLV